MKAKMKRIYPNISSENAKKFTSLIEHCLKVPNHNESLQDTVDIVFNAVILAGINVI